MSFIATADPLILAMAFFGVIVLIGLALFRRRHLLFLVLVLGSSFSGSIWPALDSAGALVRWLIIILLAMGVIFAKTKPGLPMALFGTYILFSASMCVFAPLPTWSIQQAFILVALFLATVAMADSLKTRKDISRLCVVFIVVGMCWGIMGAMSLRELVSAEEGGERFSGSNISPGVYVQIGGLLLPFVLWGVLQKWNVLWRCCLIILFVSMVLTLIASGQRTGTFAGLIACVPLLFRSQIGKLALVLTTFGASALILYAFAGVNQRQTEFVMTRFFSTSTTNRTDIWKDAVIACMENPILGEGPGSNRLTRDEIWGGKTFHNMYLMVWFDAGLPGLVFFTASLGVGLWFALTMMRTKHDPEIAEYGRLMVGMLLSTLANGMFSTGAASPSDLSTITLVIAFTMITQLQRIDAADVKRRQISRARATYVYWWKSQFIQSRPSPQRPATLTY